MFRLDKVSNTRIEDITSSNERGWMIIIIFSANPVAGSLLPKN